MAINQIKLPNGDVFSIDEWLHWPLFSTIEGAAGASVNLRAFSYIIGQNVPQAGAISTGSRQATIADTNQVVRSKINHDEAFILYSMTYEHFALEGSANQDSFFQNAPLNNAAVAPILRGTNLRLMGRDMIVELYVGAGITKPAARCPMSYINQGVGAVAWGSGDALAINNGGATALNLNYGTGGPVMPANQRRYTMQVYIQADRTMQLKVSTPAGALAVDQDWRLRFYLDGLKRRAVA